MEERWLQKSQSWNEIHGLCQDLARGDPSMTEWINVTDSDPAVHLLLVNQFVEIDLDVSRLLKVIAWWAADLFQPSFTAIMHKLLNEGAEFLSLSGKLLRACIANDCLRLFCLLLDRGADMYDEQSGSSALYVTSNYIVGRVDFLQALIDSGAEINYAFGDTRWTPLMLACSSGVLSHVQLLLQAGADPNQPNYLDETPLHKVVKHTNNELILELVKFGANVNARDYRHRTPIMIAHIYDHSEVITLLRSMGAIGCLSIYVEQSFSGRFINALNQMVHGVARGLPKYR